MLAVLATVGAIHRPDIEPRKSGVWTFSHTVRPMPGWSIQSRTVERDWETTTLRAEQPSDARCSVAVGAAGATWVRQLPRKPTRLRVGTRSANYAERVWPNGGGAMLWWEYADTAWVIIECGWVSNPRKTLPELAGHVTLTPESVQLPYRIRSLPPHYEVTSVTRGLMSNSTVAFLARNDYPEGIIQISVRYPAGLPMYCGQQFRFGVALRQWQTRCRLPAFRGQPRLCARRSQQSWFHRHHCAARRTGCH